MEFNPTNYQLMNVSSSNLFEDENWTLDDPQSATPSLIRAGMNNNGLFLATI